MSRLSPTATGILCLVGGIAVFSVQDVILKLLSADYPLHQAMVLRCLTALPLHLALVLWLDGRAGTILGPRWPLMAARGVMNFVAYVAYYLGLAALPMADTVALFFTAPLFITLAAAALMGERIGPGTLAALAAGFAGMALVLRPGAGLFEPAALLPVLGALGYALSMLAARHLGRTETAAAMAFWGNATMLAGALILAAVFAGGVPAEGTHPSLAYLTRGWQPLPWRDGLLFALCGVIAAGGILALTQAYAMAPSSRIAPFEYSFILWAVLWGWTFWGEWPGPPAWAGIALLIGAGLALVRAEARKSRTETAAAPGGAAA